MLLVQEFIANSHIQTQLYTEIYLAPGILKWQLLEHTAIIPLINLPLTTKNEKELNIIKQIALNNGYEVSMIDKLINKEQVTKALHSIHPNCKDESYRRYRSLNLMSSFSEKIKSNLKI